MWQKTELKGGNEIVGDTEIVQDGMNVLFQQLADKAEKRNWSVVGRQIGWGR